MAKSRKKRRKRMSRMVALVLVVCGTLMIISGLSELKTMVDIHQSISQTQKKQSTLKSKKKELEKQKKNLSDPEYIEYIARGKYLVTKDGEQVFKFPDSNK